MVFNPVLLKLNLYAKLNPALLAQPRIKFSPLFALTRLKFFVNTARGELLDEAALAAALKVGDFLRIFKFIILKRAAK